MKSKYFDLLLVVGMLAISAVVVYFLWGWLTGPVDQAVAAQGGDAKAAGLTLAGKGADKGASSGRDDAAADDPLARAMADLRTKLTDLEADAKKLPQARQDAIAKKEGADEIYTNLLGGIGGKATRVAQDYDALTAQVDNVKAQSGPEAGRPPAVTNGPVTASAFDVVKSWALPLVAILSLPLLAYLAWQARKLDGVERHFHDLVQAPLSNLGAQQEAILQQATGAAQAVGRLQPNQPPLADQTVEIKKTVGQVLGAVHEVSSKLEVYREGVGRSTREAFEEFRGMSARASDSARGFDAEVVPTAVEVEPYPFPATVSDYLNVVKENSPRLKPNFGSGLLDEDPENKGPLILVKDPPSERGGVSYAVPSTVYFHRRNDFIASYSNYYDCSDPPVGQVVIHSPAKVKRVADGWEPVEKGVLEARP